MNELDKYGIPDKKARKELEESLLDQMADQLTQHGMTEDSMASQLQMVKDHWDTLDTKSFLKEIKTKLL